MRATVVRFGPELYEEMRAEAAESGVSVAQFVREAVVARMAYVAGRRNDGGYSRAAREAAARVRAESARTRQEATAVRAESKQARGHTHEVVDRVRHRND